MSAGAASPDEPYTFTLQHVHNPDQAAMKVTPRRKVSDAQPQPNHAARE